MGATPVCAKTCCGCDPSDEAGDRERWQAGYSQAGGSGNGGIPDTAIGSLASTHPHPRPWSDTRIASDPRDLIPVLKLPRAALTPSPFTKPQAHTYGPGAQHWPTDASAPIADGDDDSIPGELSEAGESGDECSIPSELSGGELGSGEALPEAPAAAGQRLPEYPPLADASHSTLESTDLGEDSDRDEVPAGPPSGAETARPPGDEPLTPPADGVPPAEDPKSGGKVGKKKSYVSFADDIARSDSHTSSVITFDMFGFKEEAEAELAKQRAEMSHLRLLLDTLGIDMPDSRVFASLVPDPCVMPDLEEPDAVFEEQDRNWNAARAEQIKHDLKELAEQKDEGPQFTSLGLSVPSPHKRRTTLGPIHRRAQRGL